MSSLKISPSLRWECEKGMPANEHKVYRQHVVKLLWVDRADLGCAMGDCLVKPSTCERHGKEKHQSNPAIPPWNPVIMTVRPTTLDLEAVRRAPVG